MPLEYLKELYNATKTACKKDWKSGNAWNAIWALAVESHNFLLSECIFIDLVSMVPGKQYGAFSSEIGSRPVVSRPANKRLFVPQMDVLLQLKLQYQRASISDFDYLRFMYTVALAPCMAFEIFDRQNKKSPATYYECLIGHLFSNYYSKNPSKTVRIPIAGSTVRLTMDFLFSWDDGRNGVHLPVKMSTRERVVQAWSHQRILDAAFPETPYEGIMVLFSETKLDSRNHEVVEICVPGQWLVYQRYLSKISLILYFDIPARYKQLTVDNSDIIVIKEFSDFNHWVYQAK